MACSRTLLTDYTPVLRGENITDPQIQRVREYFDCGTYYFDGVFNVVEFQPGMVVYHGSALMSNKLILFPLGADYYNPNANIDTAQIGVVVGDSMETIEQLLTEQIPVSAGWFGDYSSAMGYSEQSANDYKIPACDNKCVFAYKVVKKAKFVLLTDKYNLTLIWHLKEVPDEMKTNLVNMMGLQNVNPGDLVNYFAKARQISGYPFETFNFPIDRTSYRKFDVPFAHWFCKNIQYDYAGIAAPWHESKLHTKFHAEFIFCNPMKYLRRDYTNPHDWQMLQNISLNTKVGELVYNMKMYQSYNVSYHAGDLYEHSVWTALITEAYLSVVTTKYITNDMIRAGVLAAFLHDIGKCNPLSSEVRYNRNRGRYVYYAVPDHPLKGYEYLTLQTPFPVINPIQNDHGVLQQYMFADQVLSEYDVEYSIVDDSLPRIDYNAIFIEEVFMELSQGNEMHATLFRDVAALVSLHHYDLGNDLVKPFSEYRSAHPQESDVSPLGALGLLPFQRYITNVFATMNSLPALKDFPKDVKLGILELVIIISIIDVKAAQPYCDGCIKSKSDHTLTSDFEATYYQNMPKLNAESQYWPFIQNMSKKYPGGDLFHAAHYHTYGHIFLNELVRIAGT